MTQLPLRRQTQIELILAHLKSGRSITPLDALKLYGCFRLGARCHELKKMGYDIKTELVEVSGGARVARYTLK